MSIPSLFLVALMGGPSHPAPEADAPRVSLQLGNSRYRLFPTDSWQEEWKERLADGAEFGRVSESVNLPIPPALWVGSTLDQNFERDYRTQDLARDVVLGWALQQELEDGIRLFGMEVTALTDFTHGSYGLAFSRSF